jgi:hypothetical protein
MVVCRFGKYGLFVLALKVDSACILYTRIVRDRLRSLEGKSVVNKLR